MEYIFYLPAILFFVSGIPQIIKLIKTKSSDDISATMYLLTCTAIAIVVVDAFVHHNMSIFVSNSASLIMCGTTTFLTIKYKKKRV